MRKKAIFLLTVLCMLSISGCQKITKEYGGSMTLKFEPGLKLEEITWKDDSLWYLTRPMREGEKPETHTFQQSSEFGVFEGTVTVVESEKK